MADVEELLDPAWVDGVVAASQGLSGSGGHSGVVELTIGKARKAVLEIADGKVVGPGEAEAVAVSVPTTTDQLSAYADGSASMAQDYMRGDLKPVGSTGAFLALVQLFESPEFRTALPAG